ncbi:MAG: reductive dehalogenase [Candidatus Glassbacteria bacterium]|nr:reductive dehalogenase [Candidatus Glassbacteria bacterium]
MGHSEFTDRVNRRTFLKLSGASSAALGTAGLGIAGYQAGKDFGSYTGLEVEEGAAQSFDRRKWTVDRPTYGKTGAASRPDARTNVIFDRRGRFHRQYKEGVKIDDLDPLLQEYYSEKPGDFELDVINERDILPRLREDSARYDKKFILARAWSGAMSAVGTPPVNEPPKISDFPFDHRSGEPVETLEMKSPDRTSRLLKKIAHELGSTLVGITELNHDWVYRYPHLNRGFDPDKPLEVPAHWKYAVVVGSPMSWDALYASPNYSSSEDAYARSRIIAHRLAAFIKRLGYAARPHVPSNSYDLMVPPVCIDAGLGEQGRHSVLITPELGSNFRPSVVTTNLPLEPDMPIDIGVQDFCRNCKICAENCPSGAITTGGPEEVRGYRRYQINQAKCHNFWHSNLGNYGCRLCVAVCPYTRKANWLHRSVLKVAMHDPTGISHRILTALQKRFYPGPDPREYYIPSLGGSNASFRKPPWWMRAEDFIKL